MSDQGGHRGDPSASEAGSVGTAPPPPVGPSRAVPGRRLVRRMDDKVIAGVASGLGHYFGIDPVLVRIGFVVLAVAGGAGFLAYGLIWLLTPPSAQVSNFGEDTIRRMRSAPRWVAILLLVVGAAVLAGEVHLAEPGVVWGIALVALGIVLFTNVSDRAGPGPSAGPGSGPGVPPPPGIPPAPPQPGGVLPPPGLTSTVQEGVPPPPSGPTQATAVQPHPTWIPPTARIRRRRRERSGLAWGTIGATLVVVGTLALLDDAGAISLSLAQYLGLALAVVGSGLLVGTWFGRARILIVLALLLTPLVLTASLVNVPLEGGWGAHYFKLVRATGGRVYHQVAGRIVLDLTDVTGGAPARVTATMGVGTLEVFIPYGARVTVDGQVGAGALGMFGRRWKGLKLEQHRVNGPASGPRISLHLAASFGEITVFRQAG